MRLVMLRKVLLASVVMVAAGLVIGINPLSIGQEGKEKKAKGKLPNFYGGIVTETQRQQIYSIQDKYAKQIADAQAQLDAVTRKRDAEIEGTLNAEQKAQLKKAQDEAAAKKKKAAEDKKSADKAK